MLKMISSYFLQHNPQCRAPGLFLLMKVGPGFPFFDHKKWAHAHIVWCLKALSMVE
jgi:hypothetical protein